MIAFVVTDVSGKVPGDTGGLASPQFTSFVSSLASAGEPGLAVGVYRDGSLAMSATAGAAVVEHDVAITEHTAFDIASVSKHMTSTCVLLLVRDGRLRLDADVRERLPELALTRPVTLRQCLTHTAGLRDYFTLCELAGIPVAGIDAGRFMDLMTGQRELDFAPGSAFSYSNTGYVIAAALVRRVTGEGLPGFARDRVFGPLGMTATHFRDDVSALVPHLAAGYLAGAGGFRRCDVTEETVGDGAVVTTIEDLAAWHGFMCSGAVLGTDIRDGLLARQPLTGGARLDYALGVESIDVAGTAAWWHSGSWAGYRTAVIYLPCEHTGVSVLANRNDHNASLIAFAVAWALITGEDPRSCYDRARGMPAPADVALGQLGAMTGLWHDSDQDLFLDVRKAGSGLIAVRGLGTEYQFRLCADGAWHGLRQASAMTYTVWDGTLIAGLAPSARPEGRYRQVPRVSGPSPVPVGTYFNGELNAYADVACDHDGVASVTIGLAAPRVLQPAGAGVWRNDELTMRVGPASTAPGVSLLISAPGACRLRFDQVPDPPQDRNVIRGLRAHA
jgi:CubicO group peptidase (beta-lactamase class C family)